MIPPLVFIIVMASLCSVGIGLTIICLFIRLNELKDEISSLRTCIHYTELRTESRTEAIKHMIRKVAKHE